MKTKLTLLSLILLVLAAPAIARDRHENAILVVDVSGTIQEEQTLFQAVKVLRDMNSRFPDYVRSAGVSTFGNLSEPQLRWPLEVQAYDKKTLDQALADLAVSNGPTPLGAAVSAAEPGLAKTRGKTALIIVSDGINTGGRDPVAAVRDLKKKRGNALCVFTIQVGEDEIGGYLLEELVRVGECGRASRASALRRDQDVQDLVDYIFPPEPIKDSDGAGVLDPDDQCPDTPRGAKVDARGCWVLAGVLFETASAEIKPEFEPVLEEVEAVLVQNPEVIVVIQGHTDDRGSESYNQKLSEQRAQEVERYLVGHGIDPARLSAEGYGESMPIADNDTEQGRAQNRRVELMVKK